MIILIKNKVYFSFWFLRHHLKEKYNKLYESLILIKDSKIKKMFLKKWHSQYQENSSNALKIEKSNTFFYYKTLQIFFSILKNNKDRNIKVTKNLFN